MNSQNFLEIVNNNNFKQIDKIMSELNILSFITAIQDGDLELVQTLITQIPSNYNLNKALVVAYGKGHLEIVKFLIYNNINVNGDKDKIAILNLACKKKDKPFMEYLVRKGLTNHKCFKAIKGVQFN